MVSEKNKLPRMLIRDKAAQALLRLAFGRQALFCGILTPQAGFHRLGHVKSAAPRRIFLVRRKSGGYLILHPFRAGDSVFDRRAGIVLEGMYASEPAAGEAEAVRLELHGQLEKGLRADALDRGFYARLLASGGAFLALYLFLSILIRDPVPLVDELLVGGLGAFAVWFALERRALSSGAFALRAAGLGRALDSAIFRPSGAVRVLEETLQDAETLGPERFARLARRPADTGLTADERLEMAELAECLEAVLPSGAVETARRALSGSEGAVRRLGRLAGRRHLDLPVLLSWASAHLSSREDR
ncbi:MAG TPA: hypothetical protein VLH39_05255 [Magnetospirillaceae bacterium]|nr:hypothetical protein [Magnetospirillaceae bacterium]